MAGRILQINFKFNVTRAEFEDAASQLAESFAKLEGLRWKVWLMNEEASEAGGIYFFDNESSLNAYLTGPLAAQVMNHPALSDMSVKQFEVIPDITAITRGPV